MNNKKVFRGLTVIASVLAGLIAVAARTQPPPTDDVYESLLKQQWTVAYVSDEGHLGLKEGDRVTIDREFWGEDEFDLDIDAKDSRAKALEKPTLHFINNLGDEITDNNLTKKQAEDLLAQHGHPFLRRFHELISRGVIRSYVYGVAYIREEDGPSPGAPHIIVSTSFTRDGGPREYLLSVVSLTGHPHLGYHNGVVHGDP